MTFKEFLIIEADADSASDFFYGLQLYPSDAFDFEPCSHDPGEMYLLRSRWKTEKEQGRKFHNIDHSKFQKIRFTSVVSKDAPDAGDGFWRHKPDKGSSVKVIRGIDLQNIAIGKNSKDKRELTKSNPTISFNLDSLFGDKGTNKPQTIPDDFDKPWRKVYEDVTPFQVIGFKRDVNSGLGVRSKYVGPDETDDKAPGEEEEPEKFADFGFEHWKKKRMCKKHQQKS